ncbi:MAG TPA: hypothetical protein PLM08_07900, partial [Polyangiaceae bacterium]|nr:hypothetical protein [Polyangiaceae bacterium]
GGGYSSSPTADAGADAHGEGGTEAQAETGPIEHKLSSILVEPTNSLVELDLNAVSSQPYTALGRFLDGTTEDVTDKVTWTLSDPEIGVFSGASLDLMPMVSAGAKTTRVRAELDGVKGEAQLTVVAYRKTGPKTDFFFVLPFDDPQGSQDKPLEFSTDVRSLDVFFAMDTTGSMLGEIKNLQQALINQVITPMQQQIPDSQFGAGAFEDFPVGNYGATKGSECGKGGSSLPDQPLKLFSVITSDANQVQNAVNQFDTGQGPIGCGLDWPEAMIEALYQISTGEGLSGPGLTNVPANHVGVGGVGFRQGSMPVIIPITDAMSHAPGENAYCPESGESVNYTGPVAAVAHDRQQTKDALDAICARVVGVASIETALSPQCSGQADEEDFARATGARIPPEAWDTPARPANCAPGLCCTDMNGAGRQPDPDGLCPLVFRVNANGQGLGGSVVTGLQMLTRFAAFDVVTETVGETEGLSGEALPPGTTTADFLLSIVPDSYEKPPPPPNLPEPTMDSVGFQNVTPGTLVRFQVTAFNDFVKGTEQAQFFRATIKVLAGGCTDLDAREVLILVPPNPIVIK